MENNKRPHKSTDLKKTGEELLNYGGYGLPGCRGNLVWSSPKFLSGKSKDEILLHELQDSQMSFLAMAELFGAYFHGS